MNQITSVLDELSDDVIHEKSGDTVIPTPTTTLKKDEKVENKIYIQQKDYFLETTRDRLTCRIPVNENQNSKWSQLPLKQLETIDIAIFFQQKTHIVSNLCYGLLGGISLMQLVLTYTLVKGSKHEIVSFLELYSKFGYVPSASFNILTTICLVFALDRIDLVTIKQSMKHKEHTYCSNWTLLFLYTATFVLSVLCFKFDELIAAYPESKDLISVSQDLWWWRTLNLWRCIFGLIGWFVVCITRPDDLLEHYLRSLKMNAAKNQNSSH